MARTGLSILVENLKGCVLDVGFVVEGRDETELPEAMLGVVKLSCLDLGLISRGSAITETEEEGPGHN